MKLKAKDQDFLSRIQDLKVKHPSWGYRRIWSYLKYRQNLEVNKKRIYRIMKDNRLLVLENKRLRAKRAQYPYRSKPRATRVNQFWGIDMTKIMIGSFGWLYLTIILDWYSKKIVGHSLSIHSRVDDWLAALDQALNNQFPQGVRAETRRLLLVSDNGSQPTSKKFMDTCALLGIEQIFASYNNPKGNADTERVLRTIKEDLIWVREWDSPFELEEELRVWIDDYNGDYPHSTLSYQTPIQFEKEQLLLTTKTDL